MRNLPPQRQNSGFTREPQTGTSAERNGRWKCKTPGRLMLEYFHKSFKINTNNGDTLITQFYRSRRILGNGADGCCFPEVRLLLALLARNIKLLTRFTGRKTLLRQGFPSVAQKICLFCRRDATDAVVGLSGIFVTNGRMLCISKIVWMFFHGSE